MAARCRAPTRPTARVVAKRHHDCTAQCGKDFANDLDGQMFCLAECVGAVSNCKRGEVTTLRPDWPGRFGAEVPGLTIKGDRTIPEKEYDLVVSRSAVLVEVRARDVDAGCSVQKCAVPELPARRRGK